MLADLSYWLRRRPKPFRLRIRVGDEERIVEISAGKARWDAIEETVRSSGATAVECLDEQNNIIRAMRIGGDDDAGDDEGPGAREKAEDKAHSRSMKELSGVLDRYGARMNESFLAGVKASSASQGALVELVSTLTEHLSLAITNLHNVSVNLSNIVQESALGADAPNGGGNTALLGQVLTMALAKNAQQGQDPPKGKK
jgi:hypothetical protein